MSRLTVRLPESLHERLSRQAEREGVSLNHYIVYTLTRMTTVADLDEQRRTFEAMTRRFDPEEAEEALHEVLEARP